MLLNGEPTGETRLNALLCGHFGVPVAFVAGDDTVCREAKNVLGDDLPTFAVKDGIDMFTANCLHPEVSQKGIRGASRRFETWEAPGLHDGFAGHVRLRVQLDDNRGDLRVHRGQQAEPLHDGVHDRQHAERDEGDLRRAAPRAPGGAEGDLL